MKTENSSEVQYRYNSLFTESISFFSNTEHAYTQSFNKRKFWCKWNSDMLFDIFSAKLHKLDTFTNLPCFHVPFLSLP